MKLIYKKDTKNNICVLHIFYPLTLEVERDLLGVGFFTLAMLLKATKKYDEKTLAFLMESKALSISFSRTANYINISILFDKNNIIFDEVIGILEEILLNPRFDEQEILKLKQEELNAITARFDDISNVCSDEFLKNIYSENDYKSFLNIGTEPSIQKIARQNLVDFHSNYLLKIEPIVSFVGNIEKQEIFDKLSEIFGKEKLELKNKKNDYKENDLAKQIEMKKEFNQAYIMLGFSLPDVRDENFLKIKLINNYLGAGMTSILFDRIREQLGLVYEIGSTFSSYADTNFWQVHLGLDKSNIDKAVNAILEEMQKFAVQKIDNKSLEILKQRMKSYDIFKQQKKSNSAFLRGLYELLGLGSDFNEKSIFELEKITKKEVDKTIDEVFNNRKYCKVIVK